MIGYICGMEVPVEVLQAASGLVEMFGSSSFSKWEKDGREVYLFHLPEDEETGFPFLFVYEPEKPVKKVTGPEALALLASLGVE